MGSLMAGWDSPRLRSKKTFEKSSSFTRDEINQYWKDKQPSDEEKSKQMSELASSEPQNIPTTAGAQVQKWNSFHGVSEVRHDIPNTNSNDWSMLPAYKRILNLNFTETGNMFAAARWKKTNYAYLNDRPDESFNTKGNNSKFLAQIHAGEISPVVLNYSKSMPSSSTFSPSPSVY